MKMRDSCRDCIGKHICSYKVIPGDKVCCIFKKLVEAQKTPTNTGSPKLREDDFERFYNVYRDTCPVHWNEMETLRNFFNIVVAQLRAGA